MAAYARTSLILRRDPQNQLVHIRSYVDARKDTLLVNEFVDQMSGMSDKRPELDSLLGDIKRRKVDVVVVSALDRLGRNAAHLLKLADIFRENNVGLISLREAIDLQTPSGKAFFTILAAISELDRNQIAERIRFALAAKKLIAEKTGSGWRAGRPNVITEPITLQVLELRKQNYSIRQIEKMMNKAVSRSSIEQILRSNRQNGSGVPGL